MCIDKSWRALTRLISVAVLFLFLASCESDVLKHSATIIIRDGHVIMTFYDEDKDAVYDWKNVEKFLRFVLDNHSQKDILVIVERVEKPRVLASYAVRKVIRFLRRGGATLEIRDERQGLR